MKLIKYTVFFALSICAHIQAAETYLVDSSLSTITWDGKSTLHDFSANAVVKSGIICLSSGLESGYVAVDATTLKTDNPDRDVKMHNEFMQTQTYADISFALRRFQSEDKQHARVFGTWHMHGVDKDISIPIEITDVAGTKHITSTFSLKFTEWGIERPVVLVISMDETVTIHLDLVLKREDNAVVPNAPIRNLKGITLPDALGQMHQLENDTKNSIVIFHNYNEIRTGMTWGERLAEFTPTETHVFPILDGRSIEDSGRERLTARIAKKSEQDHSTIILDWDGAIETRLHTVPNETNVIIFNDKSECIGNVSGMATSDAVRKVLEIADIKPTKNITELTIIDKGRRRNH